MNSAQNMAMSQEFCVCILKSKKPLLWGPCVSVWHVFNWHSQQWQVQATRSKQHNKLFLQNQEVKMFSNIYCHLDNVTATSTFPPSSSPFVICTPPPPTHPSPTLQAMPNLYIPSSSLQHTHPKHFKVHITKPRYFCTGATLTAVTGAGVTKEVTICPCRIKWRWWVSSAASRYCRVWPWQSGNSTLSRHFTATKDLLDICMQHTSHMKNGHET